MIITIYQGCDDSYITLGSRGLDAYDAFESIPSSYIKDVRYASWEHRAYIDIPSRHIYKALVGIATYVNNELGEECSFEVD